MICWWSMPSHLLHSNFLLHSEITYNEIIMLKNVNLSSRFAWCDAVKANQRWEWKLSGTAPGSDLSWEVKLVTAQLQVQCWKLIMFWELCAPPDAPTALASPAFPQHGNCCHLSQSSSSPLLLRRTGGLCLLVLLVWAARVNTKIIDYWASL